MWTILGTRDQKNTIADLAYLRSQMTRGGEVCAMAAMMGVTAEALDHLIDRIQVDLEIPADVGEKPMLDATGKPFSPALVEFMEGHGIK